MVLAGYAVALAAAWIAVDIRQQHTQGADAQASAGMYAFGDLMLGCGVFGLIAIVPTALALYFLRGYERFWNGLAVLALVFAVTGPVVGAALALTSAWRGAPAFLGLVAAYGVLRLLPGPLLALMFLLAAGIAAFPRARRWLFTAGLIETAMAAYTFFSLCVRQRWW